MRRKKIQLGLALLDDLQKPVPQEFLGPEGVRLLNRVFSIGMNYQQFIYNGINVRLGNAGAPFDFDFSKQAEFAQKLEYYYESSKEKDDKSRKTYAFRQLREKISSNANGSGDANSKAPPRRARGRRKTPVKSNALPDIPTLRKYWRLFYPERFKRKLAALPVFLTNPEIAKLIKSQFQRSSPFSIPPGIYADPNQK